MDTAFAPMTPTFEQALAVHATVVSVSRRYAVADCGLKALGMDHGLPTIAGASVWLCSDEHITFAPDQPVAVGDRVAVRPAHVDPTVAYHERMHVTEGDQVVETWPVDLRGW
jgi:D-serine deaminase-like pyridoxal phosphate-dependent protein